MLWNISKLGANNSCSWVCEVVLERSGYHMYVAVHMITMTTSLACTWYTWTHAISQEVITMPTHTTPDMGGGGCHRLQNEKPRLHTAPPRDYTVRLEPTTTGGWPSIKRRGWPSIRRGDCILTMCTITWQQVLVSKINFLNESWL